MPNEKQILKAILKVAGNPSSGAIAALAPEMAKAIAELDSPPEAKASGRVRETRVTGPVETRQQKTPTK